MRALVLYCHPDPASFTAAVLDRVLTRLREAGAEVRLRDLYADRFDPVLTQAELDCYLDTDRNCLPVASDVDALQWCDTLIFVYPTWWYGLPAVLKGWLDRVLVPGVAFRMPSGPNENIGPGLTHVIRIGVFTTCGASSRLTWAIGAPGRRTLLRGLRAVCAARCRTAFAAHYLMDSSTDESRRRHLQRVERAVDRLVGVRRWPSWRPVPA